MSSSDPQAGSKLGSWTLDRRIHRGNQTEIWKARDGEGANAIKIALSNDWSDSLDREVGVLCETQLPGVVRFIEAEAGGRWMVMEWVDGERSSTWAVERSVSEISALLGKLSSILAQVHALGTVHGDLAPSNILVDSDDLPTLLDFGLSVGTESMTPRVGLHGTPGYVAPELLDGGLPSPESDAYALGALGYRLLTGHHPFGEIDLRTLQLHPRVSIPAPPSSVRSDIPQELDALVLRLLSRNPTRRPSPARVAPLWLEMASRPPSRPIVGNASLRSTLRDAIAKVIDGETLAILVHGPDGSGRRLLISEARRIGTLMGLEAKFADFGSIENQDILERALIREIDDNEGLLLVRARQAVPKLESRGLVHLRPSPLDIEDVGTLVSITGMEDESPEQLHADTQGHPAAVWARLGHSDTDLVVPPVARTLLDTLRQGPLSIAELSRRIGVSPHEVLDLADPLLNQGAVIELEQGTLLGLPENAS